MLDRRADWVEAHWLYLALGLLGMLLIYASQSVVPDSWPNLALLCKEAGFAAVVATLLIFTIERVNRDRHQRAADALLERINTDLFRAIYQRYIPKQIFAEVEKCLLKSNVLRENYSVDYSLDFLDENCALLPQQRDLHLKCSIFSKYRVVNLTDSAVVHPVELHLERPVDDALLPYAVIDEIHIDGNRLGDDVVRQATRLEATHLIFCHQVSLDAGASIDVSITCRTMRRRDDMEVWASRIPATGLTLRVNAPSKIKVQATANHSEPLKEVKMNNDKVHIWELNHGIFPFQSVIFWWGCK